MSANLKFFGIRSFENQNNIRTDFLLPAGCILVRLHPCPVASFHLYRGESRGQFGFM